MSQSNQPQHQNAPKPSAEPERVRVRLKTRYLVTYDHDQAVYKEPGDIIELPKAEADALVHRAFEGYPTTHDARWTEQSDGGATCAQRPLPGGLVRDSLADYV